MAVVNPPAQLGRQLRSLLPWLRETLAVDSAGGQRVVWLESRRL